MYIYITHLFYKQDISIPAFVPLSFNLMKWEFGNSKHLYRLIDGIRRPNRRRDYSDVIEDVSEEAMANHDPTKYFLDEWEDLDDNQKCQLVSLQLH